MHIAKHSCEAITARHNVFKDCLAMRLLPHNIYTYVFVCMCEFLSERVRLFT